MKLNTFSSNKQLNTMLRNVVFDMNQLLGESYAFANFHILRILHAKEISPDMIIPKIDRSFYYRCIIAMSVNKARDSALEDDLRLSNNSLISFVIRIFLKSTLKDTIRSSLTYQFLWRQWVPTISG